MRKFGDPKLICSIQRIFQPKMLQSVILAPSFHSVTDSGIVLVSSLSGFCIFWRLNQHVLTTLPGKAYAMMSLKIMLANILRVYRFKTNFTMDTVKEKFSVTMKLNHKHLVSVERRKSQS